MTEYVLSKGLDTHKKKMKPKRCRELISGYTATKEQRLEPSSFEVPRILQKVPTMKKKSIGVPPPFALTFSLSEIPQGTLVY